MLTYVGAVKLVVHVLFTMYQVNLILCSLVRVFHLHAEHCLGNLRNLRNLSFIVYIALFATLILVAQLLFITHSLYIPMNSMSLQDTSIRSI